jgi:hypothetical protein
MALKEGLLAGGAFIAGTAIGIHGGIERFSDWSDAHRQFSQAKSDTDLVINSLKALNPQPQNEAEIPDDLRNRLYIVGHEYKNAQRRIDVLDGETYELSTVQAKTIFNLGEMLIGVAPIFLGFAGVVGAIKDRREKRFSQEAEAKRMQYTLQASYPFQEASGKSGM